MRGWEGNGKEAEAEEEGLLCVSSKWVSIFECVYAIQPCPRRWRGSMFKVDKLKMRSTVDAQWGSLCEGGLCYCVDHMASLCGGFIVITVRPSP
jgi:hypothetical protein